MRKMIDVLLSIFFLAMILLYSSWILLLMFPKRNKIGNYENFPRISVVVPAYNEEEKIRETINSISDAEYPEMKEIIIVNDGSTDRTAEIVEEIAGKNHEVKLLDVERGGKSNAINKGIEISSGEIIVVIDADSLIGKNSLVEIVKPFSDDSVGGVSGIIRGIETKNPLTWFQDFEYILSSGWRFICDKVDGTYIFPGIGAFRKGALIEVGGFSDDTLSEDFDIGIRLRKRGYKLVMSRARIYTQVPRTFVGLAKQRMRWGKGTIQVIRKHSDVLLNRKFGSVGIYGIPTQLYWLIHGFFCIPLTLYQVFDGYLKYFFSHNDILSLGVLKYIFSWFSIYGMFEYTYKTLSGEYAMTIIFVLAVISFLLNLTYISLVGMKISRFVFRHMFVLFFFFPYSLLIISLYVFPNIATERKGRNLWEKVH